MRYLTLIFALLFASFVEAQITPIPGGGGGGITSGTTGVFSLSSYGGIDDDVTDNCANGSVAAFTAAVNAYSGAQLPQAIISAGVSNKAYKLATNSNTCSFIFTRPVTVHLWGSIDCAQTANNCMQFGATGQSGFTTVFKYQIDGGGNFLGGANLTNGGIEVEPWVGNSVITGLNFINFGATNATVGSCTNYAITIDTPVAESTVSYNQLQATDSGVGRCGFANLGGASAGQNTVFFVGNTMLGGTGANCGSQGIIEGGSYGTLDSNNMSSYAIPIRLQGIGSKITKNNLDNFACVQSGGGAQTAIQYGAASSSTAVGSFNISENTAQFAPTHTVNLFGQAHDSTATLHDIVMVGNANSIPALGSTANLIQGTLACTGSGNQGTLCYEYGNITLLGLTPCAASGSGWQIEDTLAACSASNLAANTGPTTILTPGVSKSMYATCQVFLTQQATTSSTLPTCSITFTDVFSSVSQTIPVTPTLGASATVGCNGTAVTNPPVGTSCQGTTGLINPANAVAVTYSTSGYASVGGTPMQYKVFVKLYTK